MTSCSATPRLLTISDLTSVYASLNRRGLDEESFATAFHFALEMAESDRRGIDETYLDYFEDVETPEGAHRFSRRPARELCSVDTFIEIAVDIVTKCIMRLVHELNAAILLKATAPTTTEKFTSLRATLLMLLAPDSERNRVGPPTGAEDGLLGFQYQDFRPSPLPFVIAPPPTTMESFARLFDLRARRLAVDPSRI
ncbi:hypothetical protein IB279_13825 [Ensifer sp. ENS06]|uniref:hypothetical protein n=1 Tax=Ensifer sp. ENS06 TaxID=2769276 RepID=UPI0017808728|nr:hypothetical protein [Ensifer sp. ENS06]MBD9624022.1 hypothetical protein [Ensifer sp. ENS06]